VSEMAELIRAIPPKQGPSWVEQASAEIAELQAAQKASPKDFHGNRARGIGAGQARVTALLRAARSITQALNDLDRGM
jgi:hypothetical protein